MIELDFDTRAVLVGAACVFVLGLPAIRRFEAPFVLVPLGFVGGAISGYVSPRGSSAPTDGTIGVVVGFLLVTPAFAERQLAGLEGASRLSAADSAFFILVVALVFVVMLGIFVLASGYLGGLLAEIVTDSRTGSDDGHRYFE